MQSIYNIEVVNQDGSKTTLKQYEGKVLLIVNTATHCGFTKQYAELETIYLHQKDKGFEILDFPCNQFGRQAKGSDEEINAFCSLKFKTTFKRFKKVNVNGKDASDLFKFLKEEKGGILGDRIKWNFTKFLINKNGEVIERFAPTVTPIEIESKIVELLK